MARDFSAVEHGAISDASANTITAFSLAGWFKWDGNQHSTTLISGTDATGPTVTWSHALRMSGGDLFQAYAFDGTTRSLNGTTAATAGTWYHVAMTAANGGPMKIYVNGALEATSGFTVGTLTTVLDRWRLGGATSGTLFWSGDMAEVALFYSVLSAGDIAALANGSSSPNDVGAPRWYFPLCGTGTETDLSANGLTLTWPVSTPPGSAHPTGIANGCGFATPIVGSFAIGADITVENATRAISFNVSSSSFVDTTPHKFTVHGGEIEFDGDVHITGDLTVDGTGGGGSGDVVGPASATDNAIARFDLTTGKLIQNSGITIADAASGTLAGSNSGDVTLAGTPNYLTLAAQVITRALIDLTAHVTGRLPFANLVAATGASKLLGRGSAGGGGNVEELTLGAGLSLSGTTLFATGAGSEWSVLTNGDPVTPELIFDSNGDVIMVETLR